MKCKFVPKWEWYDAYVLGKFVTVKSPIWAAYYGWRKHTILHNQHGLYQLLCYHYAKVKQLLTWLFFFKKKKRVASKHIQMRVQAGLILCDLFFHSFTLTWLENLHHFSNSQNNFQFNAIWHWLITLAISACSSCSFIFNNFGLFLLTWVINVNLRHLMQSKWKTDKRQSVLKRN